MVALVMRLVVGSCRVDEEHARGQMPTAPSRIDDMLVDVGLTTPGGPDGAVRLPRTCLHLSAMTTGLRCGLRHATQPTHSAGSKPTTDRLEGGYGGDDLRAQYLGEYAGESRRRLPFGG
jgi:hypothetical protein